MRIHISFWAFLFSFLLVYTANTSAQFFDVPTTVIDSSKIKITYTLSWKEDSTNLQRVRKENMIVLAGSKQSLFMSDNFYKMTFLGRKAEKEGRLQQFFDQNEMDKYRTRFSYRIILNYPEGSYTYYDKVMPDYLQYTEALSTIKWELTDQTDSIGKYKVQNAHCYYGGREWIAWYTTEVPLNEGPYKFRGLPGLIIRMYDKKRHYEFEMTKLERFETAVAIEFEDWNWIPTTRNEFIKAQKNFRNDIINRAKEAGASSESQQTAARNMMKKNNPIELRFP